MFWRQQATPACFTGQQNNLQHLCSQDCKAATLLQTSMLLILLLWPGGVQAWAALRLKPVP